MASKAPLNIVDTYLDHTRHLWQCSELTASIGVGVMRTIDTRGNSSLDEGFALPRSSRDVWPCAPMTFMIITLVQKVSMVYFAVSPNSFFVVMRLALAKPAEDSEIKSQLTVCRDLGLADISTRLRTLDWLIPKH